MDADVAPTAYRELDEPEVRETPWHHRLDWSRLREPAVLYYLGGAVFGLLILLWPNRSAMVLGLLLGLTLLTSALMGLLEGLRGGGLGRTRMLALLLAVGIAVALITAPRRSDMFLGVVLGLALAVYGLWTLTRCLWRRGQPDRRWRLASGAAMTAAGLLVAAFPRELLAGSATVVALAMVGLGWAGVLLSLDPANGPVEDIGHAGRQLQDWLRHRYDTAGVSVTDLEEKVVFGPPLDGPKVARFVTMMVLASGISSLGVIADSTAVVIGAMLVAPLMTPLMAMALSLVMGWTRRLAYASLVALAGILLAIGVGMVLGWLSPTPVDVTNSQFTSRVTPTVLDLMTAVFAGAAGAYAMSRRAVSDSLPGVAIAISLVPPLTIVGLSFSQGAWSSGTGALLLFLTNMVSILVVGGITFVLAGAAPWARMTEGQRRMRTWLAALVTLTSLVVGGLMLNGAELARNTFRAAEARDVAETWVTAYPDHAVQQARMEGDQITVIVVGPQRPALDPDTLAADATEAFGTEVSARVRLVVQEDLRSGDG